MIFIFFIVILHLGFEKYVQMCIGKSVILIAKFAL